jgi:prepilin-type N-terminal cleavage/methylation domain-containing protein
METLTKKRGEEGFTLIELLIVIVILGILAAIVVFAVGTTGSNSAAAACKADAKSVEVALESYKAQNNNTYPPQPASVSTADAGWAALLGTGNSGAPFLRAIPGTSHYEIWWDTSGSVFIGGAGAAYPLTPGTANNFDLNQDPKTGACSVAS